jgi:hypothetical protein
MSLVDLVGNLDVEVVAGIATFSDLRVVGPLGADVELAVDCVVATHGLVELTATLTVQLLTAQWIAYPTLSILPYEPLPAMQVLIRNHSGAPLLYDLQSEMPLSCMLTIASASVPDDRVLLSGRSMKDSRLIHFVDIAGVAHFDEVAIAAPFGSVLTLKVACTLGGAAGYTMNVLTHSISVQNFTSQWLQAPTYVLPQQEFEKAITVEVLNTTNQRYLPLAQPTGFVQIFCTLSVHLAGSLNTTEGIYLKGDNQVEIDDNGIATFEHVTPIAPMDAALELQIACSCGTYDVAQSKNVRVKGQLRGIPADYDETALIAELARQYNVDPTDIVLHVIEDSSSGRRLASSVSVGYTIVKKEEDADAMIKKIEELATDVSTLQGHLATALGLDDPSVFDIVDPGLFNPVSVLGVLSYSHLVARWLEELPAVYQANKRFDLVLEIGQQNQTDGSWIQRIPNGTMDVECAIVLNQRMSNGSYTPVVDVDMEERNFGLDIWGGNRTVLWGRRTAMVSGLQV